MTTITRSIFDSGIHIAVNPVNTVGVMGKGLALEFKQRYPEMYQAYRRACVEGRLVIGKVHIWDIPETGAEWSSVKPGDISVVINLPTKANWRSPSFWTQIEPAARFMVKALQYIKYPVLFGFRPRIGIPRLGSGLGGLSWTDIKPLLEPILAPLEPAYEVVFVEPPYGRMA